MTTPTTIGNSPDALAAAQFILDGYDESNLYDAYGPHWRLMLGLRVDPDTLR